MSTNDYVTLLISVVALLFSVVSAVIAYRQQDTALRTTIRDQLTSVVQDLIAAQGELTILDSVPREHRDATYSAKQSSINQKLTSLARQACELDNLQPTVGFDVEFFTIASALETSGDMPLSERYLQKAIDRSPSKYYRVVNLGLYASFLFRQSQSARGRPVYEEAVSILPATTDFNRWTNGHTHRSWLISEHWNVPPPDSRAQACYGAAKKAFESIEAPGMRNAALDELERIWADAQSGAALVNDERPTRDSPANLGSAREPISGN